MKQTPIYLEENIDQQREDKNYRKMPSGGL